jgi:hypothetical protein
LEDFLRCDVHCHGLARGYHLGAIEASEGGVFNYSRLFEEVRYGVQGVLGGIGNPFVVCKPRSPGKLVVA